MNNFPRTRFLTLLVLALVAFGALAVQAGAHGRGDRSARIDSDRDSASNRCEKQAELDSTKTDTDDNGTIDGLEDSDGDGANNAAESRMRTNCGEANTRFRIKKATVASYSAESGLTLKIGKRGLVTGAVSEKLVCEQEEASDDSEETTLSRRGPGGESGEESGEERGPRGRGPGGESGEEDGPRGRGPQSESGEESGPRGRGPEGEEEDTVACTVADLTEGTEVARAKFKNGSFTKIRLAAPDAGDF